MSHNKTSSDDNPHEPSKQQSYNLSVTVTYKLQRYTLSIYNIYNFNLFAMVSAITSPDRTGTSPGHGGVAALRRPMSTPPIKNETGINPYYWTLTDPRGAIILNKWRLNKCYNSIITGFKHALQPLSTMRMYCEQCACAATSHRIPKHFRTGNRLCYQSGPDW